MRVFLKSSLIVIMSMVLISCATSSRIITYRDLAQPLTTVGKHKSPRVSVVAPPNTQVALELFRNNERICTIVGQLVAYVHRIYDTRKNSNLLIADGVCYGAPIKASGMDYYVLNGYFVSAAGTKITVRKDFPPPYYINVVEPLIKIDNKNQVFLRLDES